MKVDFNKPVFLGKEIEYMEQAIKSGKLCGDGEFSHKVESWFEREKGALKTLLTPSCTAALEIIAILLDIQPGDEVIIPSYTFVSSANAFVLRGARIVFVDIRPDTMNIDEALIEEAISTKTKAIVVVHYAGVSCEMNSIMEIAAKHSLYVIEDAAQSVMSKYNDKALGTIGHFGAYSFHETKNYTSGGEGGLLLINDESFIERAEIIREKGTNRSQFLQGMVDKYSWVDIGSSFLPSELQAAYLNYQLENAVEINEDRLRSWELYYQGILKAVDRSQLVLPTVESHCAHNAHMFYIKTLGLEQRNQLISFLKNKEISSAFHYVPLHNSRAGKKYGTFSGVDRYTTKESERLVRLPLYYGLSEEKIHYVCEAVDKFYQ